ncbi:MULTISPECIES: hypothetical protein [unclassified Paraburkholderia]|uniref:hypothetical protein n=1 Tax=unclassified Paraburkholderia TaxID=2615204 RepID=UPI0038B7C302
MLALIEAGLLRRCCISWIQVTDTPHACPQSPRLVRFLDDGSDVRGKIGLLHLQVAMAAFRKADQARILDQTRE